MKINIWPRLLLAVLCGALVCRPALSQPRQVSEAKPDFRMSQLNKTIGWIARSLGDDRIIRMKWPLLIHWWGERYSLGDAGGDLSNAFLFVMEENPRTFFNLMSKNPRVFSSWLKELREYSFFWAKEPPCRLEGKRQQLIMILEYTKISDPKAAQLESETLARLKTIRCEQVQ